MQQKQWDRFRKFYSFLWLFGEKQTCEQTQAPNASTNGGATRLASGHFSAVSSRGKKFHLLLSIVCIFPFNYPDARRVAPISACVFFQRVSSNLKCNKNECIHSPHSTFCANCLHSALLSTFLLIFRLLHSVDRLVIYMHYRLHSALLSALVCTVCTLVCTICTTS